MQQSSSLGQPTQFYTPIGISTHPQLHTSNTGFYSANVQAAAIRNRQQKIANRLAQYHWKLPPAPATVVHDTFGTVKHTQATTVSATQPITPVKHSSKHTTLIKKLQAFWLPLTLISVSSVGLGAVGFNYLPQWLAKKQPEQPQGTAAEVSQKALNSQWQQAATQRAIGVKQTVDTQVTALQQLSSAALKDILNTLPIAEIKGGGHFGVVPLAKELLVRFALAETGQAPLHHLGTIVSPKIILVEYPVEMAEKLAPFSHILGTPIAAIVDSSLHKYTAENATMSIADATNPYKSQHQLTAGILPTMPGVPLASHYTKAFDGLDNITSNFALTADPQAIKECDNLIKILRYLYTDASYSQGNRQFLLNEFIQHLNDCANDTDLTKTVKLNARLTGDALQEETTPAFSKAAVTEVLERYRNFTRSYQQALSQLDALPLQAFEDIAGLLHSIEQWNEQHRDTPILPDLQHGNNILVSEKQLSLIDVCIGIPKHFKDFNYSGSTLITQFSKVLFGGGNTLGAGVCEKPHRLFSHPIELISGHMLATPQGQPISGLDAYHTTARTYLANMEAACKKLGITWDSAHFKAWLELPERSLTRLA